MPASYQTIDILASPQQVWTQIRHAAEKHDILYEKSPEVLIVRRENQLHTIYYLTADPELTQVRLIMTHNPDVVQQATHAADLWQWMTTLPDENISAAERDAAQTHLQTIKMLVYAISSPDLADQPHQAAKRVALAVPFPLAPMVLIGSVGGIVGVAILLTLNWLRLGQPRKAVFNSLILLVGGSVATPLAAGFFANQKRMIPSGAILVESSMLLVFGFIIWQLIQQQPYIEAWTRRTGIRPTWYRAGSGTIFLAAVGGFLLYVAGLVLLT